jgi:hypothetical protein
MLCALDNLDTAVEYIRQDDAVFLKHLFNLRVSIVSLYQRRMICVAIERTKFQV